VQTQKKACMQKVSIREEREIRVLYTDMRKASKTKASGLGIYN